jgi:hypothetical protein
MKLSQRERRDVERREDSSGGVLGCCRGVKSFEDGQGTNVREVVDSRQDLVGRRNLLVPLSEIHMRNETRDSMFNILPLHFLHYKGILSP